MSFKLTFCSNGGKKTVVLRTGCKIAASQLHSTMRTFLRCVQMDCLPDMQSRQHELFFNAGDILLPP